MMLAHTIESTIQLHLPGSIDQISTLHIIAQIRDTFGCVTEFHLPSVTVLSDFLSLSKFIDSLQKSTNNSNNDTIFQLLTTGDQNTVGQIVSSITQVFHEMNDKIVKNAALSKFFFVKN